MPSIASRAQGSTNKLRPVVELAREHTESAIATLAKITEDASASAAARVSAAVALLNRGWGTSSLMERVADDIEILTDDQLGLAISGWIAAVVAAGRLPDASADLGGTPTDDPAALDGVG